MSRVIVYRSTTVDVRRDLALAGRGAPDPLAFVGFWNWEFDPERQAPSNSSSIAVFWFSACSNAGTGAHS